MGHCCFCLSPVVPGAPAKVPKTSAAGRHWDHCCFAGSICCVSLGLFQTLSRTCAMCPKCYWLKTRVDIIMALFLMESSIVRCCRWHKDQMWLFVDFASNKSTRLSWRFFFSFFSSPPITTQNYFYCLSQAHLLFLDEILGAFVDCLFPSSFMTHSFPLVDFCTSNLSCL